MIRRLPHHAFRAALLATTMLVAGCMVGPDFLRPKPPETPGYTEVSLTTLPEAGGEARQRIATGKPVTPEWWRNFASPELDQVVAYAISDSPTLEASRANLAAARERIVAVKGGLFPQLDISARLIPKLAETMRSGGGRPTRDPRPHCPKRQPDDGGGWREFGR